MKRFLGLFLAVNLLLSLFYLDTWVSHNNTSRVLPVFSLYEHGTWSFDPYHEQTIDKALVHGHYYSEKAPLPSWLIVPVYGLARTLGFGKDADGNYSDKGVYKIGGFVAGTLPFLLLLWLVFRTIAPGNRQAVLLVMLPLYGSMLYVFCGTMFSHLMAGILLLGGYLLLREKKPPWLAGVLCGLAFLTEFSLALIFPLWALTLWIRSGSFWKAFSYGLGILPAIVVLLVYNYTITGDPLKMLYSFIATDDFAELRSGLGFRTPDPLALLGLLFGYYRGLFFYMPVLVAVAIAVARYWRGSVKGLLLNYWTPVFLIHLLLISSFFTPYGGWTYGPRYLLPVAMLLVFEGLRYLASRRLHPAVVYIPIVFGLISAWLAKSTVMYALPSEERNPLFDYVINKFTSGVFNDSNFLTWWTGASPQVAAYVWLGLFVAGTVWLHWEYQRVVDQTQSKTA